MKTNNAYPCKPQFYYIKEGFKGVKIIYSCFRDDVDLIVSVLEFNITNEKMFAKHIPTV